MTSQYAPGHRYTTAEFATLPEDNSARYELQEGVLVVSAKPLPLHTKVSAELHLQLRSQLPPELDVLLEIDVHLQPLPDTVRIPDLVVVTSEIWERQSRLTPSSDVLVAVEVRSPGSVRTDTVVKFLEYADAGIPHFWIVDPAAPVTAAVYRLVDGEYKESLRAEGAFELDEPCPLRIDLDALLPPRLRQSLRWRPGLAAQRSAQPAQVPTISTVWLTSLKPCSAATRSAQRSTAGPSTSTA